MIAGHSRAVNRTCRAPRWSLGSARVTASAPQQVAEALVTFINEEIMAPGHGLRVDDRFEAAGVDSMALLKVLLFIERTYGFWVPDEDLIDANVSSSASLARYIVARLGPG